MPRPKLAKLTFYGSAHEAVFYLVLEEYVCDDDRYGCEADSCHGCAVVCAVFSEEGQKAHGDGSFFFVGDEDEGEQQVVPYLDEVEDGDAYDSWHGQWDDHLEEYLPDACSVYDHCFF